MSIRLVVRVTSGVFAGRSFLLRPGQTIKVGRKEWADFSVPHDASMSGVHFSLECSEEGCQLRDLDSTNGTTVNGKLIRSTELADGDEIMAGRTIFRVELERVEPSISGSATAIAPLPVESASDQTAEADETPHEPSPLLVTVADRAADLLPMLLHAADAERPYSEALIDPDPDVRWESLMAAVWSRQRWLLEYCRAAAVRPSIDRWHELWLLAVLGQPSDLERLLMVGRTVELGPRRFEIYASYGHPRTVRDLLIAMESKDPATAVAAADAFKKITGIDPSSGERATVNPEDGTQPDAFAQEFVPEETLPDPRKAQQAWEDHKDTFARGLRWRSGVEVSQAVANGVADQLDMEGRWEAYLRARFERVWKGRWPELIRYRLRSGGEVLGTG